MILLRNLKKEDASELQEYVYSDLSTEQVEALIEEKLGIKEL